MVNFHLGISWELSWRYNKDILPTEAEYLKMISFKNSFIYRMMAHMIMIILKLDYGTGNAFILLKIKANNFSSRKSNKIF